MASMIWKIQCGKFSKYALSFLVVGVCSLYLGLKITQPIAPSLKLNFRPEMCASNKEDSAIPPFPPSAYAAIGVVLASGARAKIRPLVIQAIPVSMIDISGWKSHYPPMHVDGCFSPIQPLLSTCIMPVFVGKRVPFPLAQPVIVGIIDLCQKATMQDYCFHEQNVQIMRAG